MSLAQIQPGSLAPSVTISGHTQVLVPSGIMPVSITHGEINII